MAQGQKYAALPDLDSAPDLYETPSLVDDTSTVPASTTVRSTSPEIPYFDSDDDGYSKRKEIHIDQDAIDRTRLRPDQARTHFQPARVDARSVDFSDRIGHSRARRSYRTSRRRRRSRTNGTDGGREEEEYGDFSEDEEEDESLARRLARLRREVEEVRAECERIKSSPKEDGEKDDGQETDLLEGVGKLSDALDAIYTSRPGGSAGAYDQLQRQIHRFARASAAVRNAEKAEPTPGQQNDGGTTAPQSTAQSLQGTHVLARAAEFDSRLSVLENHLGLNGQYMPDIADQPPKPILPALEILDRQISTLCSSGPSLDQASQRVRQLIQDAERLEEARKAARAAQEPTRTPVRNSVGKTNSNGDVGSYLDDPERVAKINALYGTLPTIESLAPTLPLVLERLRSLHVVHTSAGQASASLDEVERRQKEQAAEIKQWREALEKVEENIAEGEGAMTGNMKVVEDWLRDLNVRLAQIR